MHSWAPASLFAIPRQSDNEHDLFRWPVRKWTTHLACCKISSTSANYPGKGMLYTYN